MWKKGKRILYSIGDKKIYFDSVLKDPAADYKSKLRAIQRLNELNSLEKGGAVNKIFILPDKLLGNNKEPDKARRVLCVEQDPNNNVGVCKIMPNKNRMTIYSDLNSKFPHELELEVYRKHQEDFNGKKTGDTISVDDMYERIDFDNPERYKLSDVELKYVQNHKFNLGK